VTAAGVASGTYSFTITGTSGSLTHDINASLVISQPAQPSFTISISPSSQSVSRTQSVNYAVTITPQNGFTGSVTLTPSGAKTGLVLTLAPSATISNTSSVTTTLTAATTNSAKKGNNTLTVTGQNGSLTKSATASLRIN
jgi:hypothetical protein